MPIDTACTPLGAASSKDLLLWGVCVCVCVCVEMTLQVNDAGSPLFHTMNRCYRWGAPGHTIAQQNCHSVPRRLFPVNNVRVQTETSITPISTQKNPVQRTHTKPEKGTRKSENKTHKPKSMREHRKEPPEQAEKTRSPEAPRNLPTNQQIMPKEKTATPEEKTLGNTLPRNPQQARTAGTPCAKRRESPLTKRN